MSCFLEKQEELSNDNNSNMKNNPDLTSKRKKKFTGGNASKRHRDRVNVEFNNLAKLLPFPESVIAKLDKSSILRLAVSYIRAKSFFKDAPINNIIKHEEFSPQIKEGSGMVTEIFSQALDGFLLVLTEDMKVLFVSESVRDYLGYCQAGIIHETFLQFVNPGDHGVIQSNMSYRKDEIINDSVKTSPQSTSYGAPSPSYSNEQFIRGLESRGTTSATVPRRFVCRMKCAYSCSSRFYTAYRTFQFTGHLRKSTIQEGREQKVFNTLVVFGTPLANNNTSSDNGNTGASGEISKADEQTSYHQQIADRKDLISYDIYATGFRIEPTLRPHVAPIPVTSKEQSLDTSTFPISKPPSLIPTSKIYHREIPRLISRSNISYTKPTLYSDTSSSESRYSDQSDDSKCSPASSPNLLWKQRNPSPSFLKYDERAQDILYSKETDLRRGRKSVLERDYQWMKMRASPEFYKVERGNKRPSSRESNVDDVYMGASMLVNMRQPSSPGPVRSYSPEDNYQSLKRYYYEEYPEDEIACYKRQRLISEPKKCNFNISSLLGLEEVSGSESRSRSAFTELITRSYIAAGSQYERYHKEGYAIPVRSFYEK